MKLFCQEDHNAGASRSDVGDRRSISSTEMPVARKKSVKRMSARENIRDAARRESNWLGPHMTPRCDDAILAVGSRDWRTVSFGTVVDFNIWRQLFQQLPSVVGSDLSVRRWPTSR
jgi:hypothetical protein